MYAKSASARGFPDSLTTAPASSLREAIMHSRSRRSFSQRSRIETFAYSFCAARPSKTVRPTISGGVFSMCARTCPVAGLMEGNVSIGMAVAAITGILTDFIAPVAAPARIPGVPFLARAEFGEGLADPRGNARSARGRQRKGQL